MKMPDDGWGSVSAAPLTARNTQSTLVFSWITTILILVLIGVRIVGRKIRANAILREDVIMGIAAIPLVTRMILLQITLDHGTNNIAVGSGMSEQEIHQRAIGSKTVLATRIFYAMFIWLAKLTASEFLKRVTSAIWNTTYETILYIIRVLLLLTFLAVVVSTLAECQPFDHYWQVVPDPGPACRSAFRQLITMGVCDVTTDLLLMALPIILIARSYLPLNQKIVLTCIFGMSIAMIVINAVRVPLVMQHHGAQQYRSLWATCEILASGLVTNAVVIGSYIRDKGIKRNRYQASIDNGHNLADPMGSQFPYLRQQQATNSEEDLFAAIGCRMPADLKRPPGFDGSMCIRPAPVVQPHSVLQSAVTNRHSIDKELAEWRGSRVSARAAESRPGSGVTTTYTPATNFGQHRPQVIRIDTSEQALHGDRATPDIVISSADLVSMAQSPRIRDAGGLLGDDEHSSLEDQPVSPIDVLRYSGLAALRSPRVLLGRARGGVTTPSPPPSRGRHSTRSRVASPLGFRDRSAESNDNERNETST